MPQQGSSVSADDLQLAELILTRDEDRSKRKGNANDEDVEDGGQTEKAIESVEEEEYDENQEELEMIMKKGKRSFILLDEVLTNTTKCIRNIVLVCHTADILPCYLSK